MTLLYTTGLTYRGVRRDGASVTGRPAPNDTPATLAKRLFDQRYAAATILRGTIVVGEVKLDSDTGKRTWWGEDAT
jgi:hypothetical protein